MSETTKSQEIRKSLQASWIEYLSFSSIKELRNNEALFLKHYINYQWDNNIFIATAVGKSCHHGIEMFYSDLDNNKKLWDTNQKLLFEKIIKIAQDYAKDEYIAKNKKPDDFWNSKTMIEFGGYSDVALKVDDYAKQAEVVDAIIPTDVAEREKAQKALDALEVEIKALILKHKEKDAKLDDFIQYGKEWSIESIMEKINMGIINWFQQVYPKIMNWKFISSEYNRTLDITDLNGEILDLPCKIIVDCIFEDENGETIIVDWKFKGQLSNEESIKPEYDMQGCTYFFGVWAGLAKKPKKAVFIEIQPSEAKPSMYLQVDLRAECEKHNIDWAKGNNGKWMTNGMMQEALLAINAIEMKPVVYEYDVDFVAKPYLLDMFLALYTETIVRLYQLLIEGRGFKPNIFDQWFDGGVTVYKEWMDQFKPKEAPDYTEEDAIDL